MAIEAENFGVSESSNDVLEGKGNLNLSNFDGDDQKVGGEGVGDVQERDQTGEVVELMVDSVGEEKVLELGEKEGGGDGFGNVGVEGKGEDVVGEDLGEVGGLCVESEKMMSDSCDESVGEELMGEKLAEDGGLGVEEEKLVSEPCDESVGEEVMVEDLEKDKGLCVEEEKIGSESCGDSAGEDEGLDEELEEGENSGKRQEMMRVGSCADSIEEAILGGELAEDGHSCNMQEKIMLGSLSDCVEVSGLREAGKEKMVSESSADSGGVEEVLVEELGEGGDSEYVVKKVFESCADSVEEKVLGPEKMGFGSCAASAEGEGLGGELAKEGQSCNIQKKILFGSFSAFVEVSGEEKMAESSVHSVGVKAVLVQQLGQVGGSENVVKRNVFESCTDFVEENVLSEDSGENGRPCNMQKKSWADSVEEELLREVLREGDDSFNVKEKQVSESVDPAGKEELGVLNGEAGSNVQEKILFESRVDSVGEEVLVQEMGVPMGDECQDVDSHEVEGKFTSSGITEGFALVEEQTELGYSGKGGILIGEVLCEFKQDYNFKDFKSVEPPPVQTGMNNTLSKDGADGNGDGNGNLDKIEEKVDIGANVGVEESGKTGMVRPLSQYLIKIPAYFSDTISQQIEDAEKLFEEKIKSLDAIRAAFEMEKAACYEYRKNFEAAKAAQRAARNVLDEVYGEINPLQAKLDRMKKVALLKETNERMILVKHTIEHQTNTSKHEKQLMQELKDLKNKRDELSSFLNKEAEIQCSFDEKVKIEKEILPTLRKKLGSAKWNYQQAQAAANDAWKTYSDIKKRQEAVGNKFRDANDSRQEAYLKLQDMRSQLHEKNKHFRMYKKDEAKAEDLKKNGDKEGVHLQCTNQVEKYMDLWNNDDQFRKEYIRCNASRTVRRLGTLDGRSLGPGEDPPIVPQRVGREKTSVTIKSNRSVATDLHSASEEKEIVERPKEKVLVKEAVEGVEGKAKKMEERELARKLEKLRQEEERAAEEFRREEEKAKEKAKKIEEQELARKLEELKKQKDREAKAAEDLKREEEKAKAKAAEDLKREEEKAKAKAAEERKKRAAEKAQARAELQAQRDQEMKEKKKEKSARQKERRKAADAALNGEMADAALNGDSSNQDELPMEPLQPVHEDVPKEAPRRQQKPRGKKIKKLTAIPPPLRKKNKVGMGIWLWVLLTVVGLLTFYFGGKQILF